ncbi:MAG: cysteine desulfurase [Nanoarchaeota archaeon]|nr:cysteine desulfurase [Nanoarchaeota archaeon]
MLNVEKIRKDFPSISSDRIYFDSGCMSLKPQCVIDALTAYYSSYPGCAGRSSHQFSEKVEVGVHGAREAIRTLIGAVDSNEVVFTKNTTEGINLVANSIGLKKGDTVVLSDKEHNSNLIPWLKLAQKGIVVKQVKSKKDNTFDLSAFEKIMDDSVKMVSVVGTSNLDGVTNPLKDISAVTHKHGASLLVDGAQLVPSHPVDVRKMDIDFLSYSGHKAMGPTGTGVLYGKMEALEKLDTFMLGGETVQWSAYDDYQLESIPARFEAGLQHYAGIIGLGVATKYLAKIGLSDVEKHETLLNERLSAGLDDLGLPIIGPAAALRSGIASFLVEGMAPNDVAIMLDKSANMMVRSGVHCVHSWFNSRGLKNGSVRASLYVYNTLEEVDLFLEEMKHVLKLC